MGSSEKLETLLNEEAQFAQTGMLKNKMSGAHVERIVNGNYEKAEGYSFVGDDEWQSLRSMISRGALAEAEALIQSLKIQDVANGEVLFEKARVLCYSGKFSEAFQEIQTLIQMPTLHPLTLMTALQIRSLCEYELERYSESLATADRVIALESVFPKSEASLYTRINRARSLAALGSFLQTDTECRLIFERVKSRYYPLNLKLQLVMVLRLMCQILRDRKIDFSSHALAGLAVSRALQSPIHEGLFLLELSFLGDGKFSRRAKQELKSFENRFEIIRYYQEKYLKLPQIENAKENQIFEQVPEAIVFLSHDTRWSFQENAFQSFQLSDQGREILSLISKGPIERETFFKNIWQTSAYHPLKHDSAIRTALKRLRQQTQVDVVSRGGFLEAQSVLILTD